MHWSNLQLSEKEFHTLFKGEFVEFEIESCVCNNNNSIQACKVSGPNNSNLLTSLKENIPSLNRNNSFSSEVFSVKQLNFDDLKSSDHYSNKALKIYYSN